MEVTIHSGGQGHAQQSSVSEIFAGLSLGEQAVSDNSTCSVDDTSCWQMTFLVRVPRPHGLEHGVQLVICHLRFHLQKLNEICIKEHYREQFAELKYVSHGNKYSA